MQHFVRLKIPYNWIQCSAVACTFSDPVWRLLVLNTSFTTMDDESKTVLMLRSLHCCQRCVLRFLGRKHIHVYANPLESCPSLWKLEVREGGPQEDSPITDQAEQPEIPKEGSKGEEICPADQSESPKEGIKGEEICPADQPESPKEGIKGEEICSADQPELPKEGIKGEEICPADQSESPKERIKGEEICSADQPELPKESCKGEDICPAEQPELPKEGSNGEQTCPACLGILQTLCNEETVEKICSDVEALNYDFKNYMLTLALPLQLDIRQHCLLTHLNEICKLSLKSTDITPIKDVFKWVCGRLFSTRFQVRFSPKSPFEVGLSFQHGETQGEVDTLYDEVTDKEPANKRRKFGRYAHKKKKEEGPTRQVIESALRGLTSRHLKRLLPHPPTMPQSGSSYSIECLHEPVFLAGRYTKHSRHLSQTPWILEGERKTESSVEEHICQPIQETLRAVDYRFASSGREDVDVRTLGKDLYYTLWFAFQFTLGRPFVVEVLNPRKNVVCTEACKELQEEINRRTTDVGVRDLQIVGRDATMKLKEGETEKSKSYMALVRVASPVSQEDLQLLNTDQEVVLKQKTPIRVLHRRPLATRERSVYSMSTERVDDLNFKLFLCTQAGTYIKEFVHGDLGRTQPNVGTILKTDADITMLDVTAVHVEWPPELPVDD
ncbi:putative tRNA pseudouridine synthase Pus10 [Strongylocentrotus purpuratus]|uniref:tRNA pseudouridine(55) synthase n=1 Tax=Strongylocentrotus purpuratus TaxID=7668 RepID=A0A7M7PRN6_STRPU|nr:putative tRNA pseudouridine synthase Pus10 [Strongylocentrotus purpuratus]